MATQDELRDTLAQGVKNNGTAVDLTAGKSILYMTVNVPPDKLGQLTVRRIL